MNAAPTSTPSAITFTDALAPVSVETFLGEYWCQTILRVPGYPGKFASIMPWAELERILEEHHLGPPKLELFQNGKSLPPERYLTKRRDIPMINSAGLINALSGGASLVLKSVDDLTPGARAFTESMEQTLQLNCWTHLFAAWRKQNAFDLHWDRWSVFVVQIAGRKRWKVYRPTLPYPLKHDLTLRAPEPTEAPVWEGVLEDGDLLYMPRGWWHVAVPEDGLSLHVSFSLDPPNGVDLLHWLADQLGCHEEMRMDLPHLAGPEAQQRRLARLCELVTAALQGRVMGDCLAAKETKIAPRPRVHLEQISTQGLTFTLDTRVRLTTARRLAFDRLDLVADPTVSFSVGAKQMKCARALVPALETLGPDAVSVRDLCGRLTNPAAAPQLQMVLAAMLAGGILATEPDTK